VIKKLITNYANNLYQDVMLRAYHQARADILDSLPSGGKCLDCGAGDGSQFHNLKAISDSIGSDNYVGIEWDVAGVLQAKKQGLTVVRGDLNRELPFKNEAFNCIFGLSVLEHLINGCQFLKEAGRMLKPGGHLILITPNLSAWFNIVLLGIGKMPSSGPHPDSEFLLRKNTPIQFRDAGVSHVEDAVPTDRHLVVFTYKVLRFYLKSLGFEHVSGRTYGIYPFPMFMQPMLEKLDPWHCHQMLFNCRK
jgi:SAM-dependent methyltransferase